MAVQIVKDVSLGFTTNSFIVDDIGGFDFAVVQFVGVAGSINFTHSNDGDAITGVTDGNHVSALNFVSVQGTNLATGVAATSTAADALYKFTGIGRYLKLSGGTATKILIRLYKIC